MARHETAPAVLAGLVNLGRSSRYHWQRHAAMHRAHYERLARQGDGRALRLLGRVEEAVRVLRRSKTPEARAYLWDAGAAPVSALDRSHPWWRAWAMTALPPKAALALREGAAPELGLPLAGLALLKLRRFEEAARVLAQAPDEAWVRRLRSRALLRSGDVEGFVTECSRSILLEEGIGDLAPGLGPMASYEPAALARAAARRTEWWAVALRGDCKHSPQVGDRAGARADLERAAELAPEVPWVWAYLGRATDSTAALDRAVSLAPDCGWFRVWRGELRRKSGELEAAIADFDAGLDLTPDYELGWSWRGAALLAAGRAAEALRDLELAAELQPGHAWTLDQLARAHRVAGRPERALALLGPRCAWSAEELGQLFARGAKDLAWRGEWRRRSGDVRGALADLSRARKHPLAPLWRARALADDGRPREAVAALARAAGPEALALRGRLRRGLGDHRGAAADLSRAARLDGTSPQLLFWSGEAQLLAGRARPALEALRRSTELEPRNRAAWAARAQAHRLLGQDALAEAALRECYNQDPKRERT